MCAGVSYIRVQPCVLVFYLLRHKSTAVCAGVLFVKA